MKKSEAQKRKKKVMLIATLSTAAIIVGGLTFAWYTSKDEVTNTFKASGNLKTVVVENFTPPTNWQPGITTDKVVQVTNTGTLDAYTRVTLTPTLSFDYNSGETEYTKDTALRAAQNKTLHTKDDDCAEGDEGVKNHTVGTVKDDGVGYVTLSSEAVDAIDKAVIDWNTDNANTDQWVQWVVSGNDATATPKNASDKVNKIQSTVTDTEYTPLKDMYLKDVVLYVKVSEGTSKETDGKKYETGYNYEFLGYIKTSDGSYYEIKVTPDKSDDTPALDYKQSTATIDTTGTGNTTNDGYNQITSTLNSTLKVKVLDSTHVEYSYANGDGDAIDKIIKVNLNEEIVGTVDNHPANPLWIKRVGDDGNILYYYNTVLKSGESTKALVKSVTFRDDYKGYPMTDGTYAEISNLVYNLNVTELSTQASIDAAVATFGTEGANDYYVEEGKGETNKLSDKSTATGKLVYEDILATNGSKAATKTTTAVGGNDSSNQSSADTK
jgi:alternate signal-mediated exported protein